MSIVETPTFETANQMDYGLFSTEDEDEAYLKNLSVHATVLASDLKFLPDRSSLKSCSLQDLRPNYTSDDEIEQETLEDELVPVPKTQQELLVKGFDVDSRIVPGFAYTVRYAGTDDYLFNGEARRLESIGMGYGKRLTFKGDRLNNNDCYFWSDSAPDGFIFNLVAVNEDAVLTVYNEQNCVVGEAIVNFVDRPQIELDTNVNNGTVQKRANVRLAVAVRDFTHSNNLVDIVMSRGLEMLEGIAEIEKSKGSRIAHLKCVKGVVIQRHGLCSFRQDP